MQHLRRGTSKDVSTQVAVNYHVDPGTAQLLFQQTGFDYASRVIAPAIQESVKQVSARFNAENLITNRETVKDEIENQILQRLASLQRGCRGTINHRIPVLRAI